MIRNSITSADCVVRKMGVKPDFLLENRKKKVYDIIGDVYLCMHAKACCGRKKPGIIYEGGGIFNG